MPGRDRRGDRLSMTTVSPNGATEQPTLPRKTDTAESTGLGAEFRIARAKKLIELREPGIGAIPPHADAAPKMQPAEPSAARRPPSTRQRGWWRGRIQPMLRRPAADRGADPQPGDHAVEAQIAQAFDIPLPGKPVRVVGRTRSWITRLALVGAPLVLIGGVAYSCGVSTGAARLVQPATITADDASAF